MASRETENNAYAKFWGDKQRALWYVMVFLEWSIASKFGAQIDSASPRPRWVHSFFLALVPAF